MVNIALRFNSKILVRFFSVGFAVILIISFLVQTVRRVWGHDYIGGIAPLFNIDREGNLPAWLSSTAFLVAAAFAFSNSQARKDDNPRIALAWRLTAVVLVFLGADEGAQLHEFAYGVVTRFGGSWHIVAGSALVGGAVFYATVMRMLPNPVRRRIVTAAIVFACGAFGMEFVTSEFLQSGGSKISYTYTGLSHTEELLEMTGLVLLLKALLVHTEQGHSSVGEY